MTGGCRLKSTRRLCAMASDCFAFPPYGQEWSRNDSKTVGEMAGLCRAPPSGLVERRFRPIGEVGEGRSPSQFHFPLSFARRGDTGGEVPNTQFTSRADYAMMFVDN